MSRDAGLLSGCLQTDLLQAHGAAWPGGTTRASHGCSLLTWRSPAGEKEPFGSGPRNRLLAFQVVPLS